MVADLRGRLPLADGSFDAVISTATFHWIPDHRALFGELSRILRPGGQLVAQCGGPGNIATVLAALARVAPGEGHPTVYATPEETRQRLLAAGFTDVATWLNPERTPFADRAALEQFLATVVLWPNLAKRDPSQHAAFVAAVADELPACELDYVRLNIQARLPAP